MIKLNDEVQSLEQQLPEQLTNVHSIEILKQNLPRYDDCVKETGAYIEYLKKEVQIKNKIEEARKLEPYLGICRTPLYGEHNKDWWSDENQVNDYLNYLRAEEANKKSKEIPHIDNKVFGLQNKADSEWSAPHLNRTLSQPI